MPGGMGFPEHKDFLGAEGKWYPLIQPRYKASPWNGQKKKPMPSPQAMEPAIPIGCGQCEACFEGAQDLCEKRRFV